jgi:hypothetical protein
MFSKFFFTSSRKKIQNNFFFSFLSCPPTRKNSVPRNKKNTLQLFNNGEITLEELSGTGREFFFSFEGRGENTFQRAKRGVQ